MSRAFWATAAVGLILAALVFVLAPEDIALGVIAYLALGLAAVGTYDIHKNGPGPTRTA